MHTKLHFQNIQTYSIQATCEVVLGDCWSKPQSTSSLMRRQQDTGNVPKSRGEAVHRLQVVYIVMYVTCRTCTKFNEHHYV